MWLCSQNSPSQQVMLGIQGVVVPISTKNTNLKRTPEKIFLQKFVLGLEWKGGKNLDCQRNYWTNWTGSSHIPIGYFEIKKTTRIYEIFSKVLFFFEIIPKSNSFSSRNEKCGNIGKMLKNFSAQNKSQCTRRAATGLN